MGQNHHLYKRGNCYWYEVTLPKRLGGKRVRCTLRTGNPQEARYLRDTYIMPVIAKGKAIEALQAIASNIEQLDNEIDEDFERLKAEILGIDQKIEFNEAFEQYLNFIRKSGLRESSVRDYKDAIHSVISDLGESEPVKSLKKNHLTKIRNEYQNKGLSAARIKFKFQRFRGFIKWCVNEGLVRDSIYKEIEIPLPAVNSKHTIPIAEKDADNAIEIKPDWTLVPRIARYTGMRLREILRLTDKDIVEINGIKCIKVSEKAKSGKERIVPVAEKLKPYLDDFSEIENTKRQFNHWNAMVKKINPDYKFHSWRSYAISQMTKNGVDPVVRMRIVGHKVTGDLSVHSDYTNIEIEQMKKAVDVIF